MGPTVSRHKITELLEEFQLALAMEEKAAETYGSLASDCDDAEARALLAELSRQERDHVTIARKLLRLAEESFGFRKEP